MPTDDPLPELFNLKTMADFRRVLRVHSALAQAFLERTGQPLELDSECTFLDMRRASRILRAEGRIRK